MENNALRKARREVAKYEKNIKEAEVKADLQRRREGLAELPDDNQHLEENALIRLNPIIAEAPPILLFSFEDPPSPQLP
ncbi:hypothetical protein Tco_0072851 [Tanacetum coccineum]